MVTGSFRAVATAWGDGAVALLVSAPRRESGLGAWGLLLCEGFGEALQTQVVVPLFGKSFVLVVQAGELHVVVAHDGAAPLLRPEVVVAVVEGV
jgi:hypothetical protein